MSVATPGPDLEGFSELIRGVANGDNVARRRFAVTHDGAAKIVIERLFAIPRCSIRIATKDATANRYGPQGYRLAAVAQAFLERYLFGELHIYAATGHTQSYFANLCRHTGGGRVKLWQVPDDAVDGLDLILVDDQHYWAGCCKQIPPVEPGELGYAGFHKPSAELRTDYLPTVMHLFAELQERATAL